MTGTEQTLVRVSRPAEGGGGRRGGKTRRRRVEVDEDYLREHGDEEEKKDLGHLRSTFHRYLEEEGEIDHSAETGGHGVRCGDHENLCAFANTSETSSVDGEW
ncbi:hypothetical protein EJB05_47953, partial [Eragrostis curvula]